MKIILKRKLKILGEENLIKFIYNIELENDNQSFKNFDIGNEEELIDYLLKNDILSKLDSHKPIYYSLSIYFFSKINNLNEISYENTKMISHINRKEITK